MQIDSSSRRSGGQQVPVVQLSLTKAVFQSALAELKAALYDQDRK